MTFARLKASTNELIAVMLKLAASCLKSANLCWNTHCVANGASQSEKIVNSALVAGSRDTTDASKRNFSIVGMELKNTLKRVSVQIKVLLQPAISRIQTVHERDECEVLQNVATCPAVSQNGVVEVWRSLPGKTVAVAGFEAVIAVVEHGQAEAAVSKQAFIVGTEDGCAKDQ